MKITQEMGKYMVLFNVFVAHKALKRATGIGNF